MSYSSPRSSLRAREVTGSVGGPIRIFILCIPLYLTNSIPGSNVPIILFLPVINLIVLSTGSSTRAKVLQSMESDPTTITYLKYPPTLRTKSIIHHRPLIPTFRNSQRAVRALKRKAHILLLPNILVRNPIPRRQIRRDIPQRPLTTVLIRIQRIRLDGLPVREIRRVARQKDILAHDGRGIDLEENAHGAESSVRGAGRRGGRVGTLGRGPGAGGCCWGGVAGAPGGGILAGAALGHGDEGGEGPGEVVGGEGGAVFAGELLRDGAVLGEAVLDDGDEAVCVAAYGVSMGC